MVSEHFGLRSKYQSRPQEVYYQGNAHMGGNRRCIADTGKSLVRRIGLSSPSLCKRRTTQTTLADKLLHLLLDFSRLSRLTESDEWKPIRKADCQALNSRSRDLVFIEGGRATADPINGEIRYNFYNSPTRMLTSATWFIKEEKSSKDVLLKPMPQTDADLVETLYQKAVEATSSLGKGLESVLNEEIMLTDGESKVTLFKAGSNALSMKKKPKGWFGGTMDLQRGYTEYSIEGEEEEMTLGPVTHVIFVIHGIGQALLNREDVKLMTLIEEMDATRILFQRRQLTEWKRACEKASKADPKMPAPSVPNRVEFLPIEWWDKIHNSSSVLIRSLRAVTLPTIQGLRAIANDVVFDVLMYLTPTFCEAVLTCVTTQMNDLFIAFQNVHPDFERNGGKYSIIGHSLGSVIAWDLLSILKDRTEGAINIDGDPHAGVHLPSDGDDVGYQAYAAHSDLNKMNARNGVWGPSLPRPMTECIPFVPDFTLFLGSPLGMFLSLRGAHAVFDEMLQMSIHIARAKATEAAAEAEAITAMVDAKDAKLQKFPEKLLSIEVPAASPFTLPSGSIYNVFHPSDPVAYRIEPLLLPEDLPENQLPPPRYLTKKGQRLRLHVQAKQFGDDLLKSFNEKKSSVRDFFTNIAIQAGTALQAIGDDVHSSNRHLNSSSYANLKTGPLKFALGGNSDRVDFSLQPGVIENEYLSAVIAHSSYFVNQDVIDFIMDLTAEIPDHLSINDSAQST